MLSSWEQFGRVSEVQVSNLCMKIYKWQRCTTVHDLKHGMPELIEGCSSSFFFCGQYTSIQRVRVANAFAVSECAYMNTCGVLSFYGWCRGLKKFSPWSWWSPTSLHGSNYPLTHSKYRTSAFSRIQHRIPLLRLNIVNYYHRRLGSSLPTLTS